MSRRLLATLASATLVAGSALIGVQLLGGNAATPQTLVSDTFSRQVSAGFGMAQAGGAYTTTNPSGMAVNGSGGVVTLAAANARTALVGPPDATNVSALSSFTLKALPTAGSVYASHMLATATNGAHFSPRVRVMPDRTLRIGIRFVSANGSATVIGTDVTPAFTASAGVPIMLRSSIAGTTSPTISVRAWIAGTAEPTAWTVSGTSNLATGVGRFGLWAYAAGGTPTTTITFDDLAVTGSSASTPAVTPTATPTTATPTPTPTATKSPTPTPTATASPSKPGSGNTGLPAGTGLTVHQGDLTVSTAGAVISGMDIRGFVRVTAPNVTIKNSIVRGAPTTAVVGLLMLTGAKADGFLIQDVTLAPTTRSAYVDGIKVNKTGTIRRVNISNTVDGISIYGGKVRVEASYIHDLAHFTSGDPNQGGGASHDDAIQVLAGVGHQIVNNTLLGGYNAAVMITQDAGTTKDLTINNNWIDGGGCSLNYGSKGAYKTGMQANSNRFGRSQRVKDCAIIHNPAMSDLNPVGNVWDDNSQPATVKRGT